MSEVRLVRQPGEERQFLQVFKDNDSMKKSPSFRQLLKQVHDDERGVVTLETILIIGAIALPILIFLLKIGWPKIKKFFNQGMQDLETEGDRVINAP